MRLLTYLYFQLSFASPVVTDFQLNSWGGWASPKSTTEQVLFNIFNNELVLLFLEMHLFAPSVVTYFS